MNASDGRLSARVRGAVGQREGVLVLEKIEVEYRLRAGLQHREVVERVHQMHVDHCPVAQSIIGCVEIVTSLELLQD